MPKSRFFCVAVEGATATDGRTIERTWIEEMAAGYNPATYGARVNMEHFRGFSPEPPFNAYGDVLAVEKRTIDLELNGKTEKRLALFAQIDPTDELVKLTKNRQKIYTSIEVAPNFAGTGKAGLVGLAVTDSPASLGTDILSFSANQPAVKALFDSRKTDKANHLSAAHETAIELEDEAQAPTGGQLLTQILSALGIKPAANDNAAPAATVAPAAETVSASTTPAAVAAPAADPSLVLALGAIAAAFESGRKEDQAVVATLSKQVGDLSKKLSTEDANTNRRPLSSGGGTATLAEF